MLIIEYVIFLTFSIPIAVIIHEYGHAFFVKLFGGKITEIRFGTSDEKVFSIGNHTLHRGNFLFGCVYFDINNVSAFQSLLISAGGIIFNIIFASIVWYLMIIDFLPNFIPFRGFVVYSFLMAIYVMIPTVYNNGLASDGKGIIMSIRSMLSKAE